MFRISIVIILFLLFKINIQAQNNEDKKKSFALQDSIYQHLRYKNDLELLKLAQSFEVDFLLNKLESNTNENNINAIILLRALNQDSLDKKIAKQFYSENYYNRKTAFYQIGLSGNPKMIPLLFAAIDSTEHRVNYDSPFLNHSFGLINSVKEINHPNAIPYLKKYLDSLTNNFKGLTNLQEEVRSTIQFINFFNTSPKEDSFDNFMKNPHNTYLILKKIVELGDKDFLPFLQRLTLENKNNDWFKYDILTARLKLNDLTITEDDHLFYLKYTRPPEIKRKKVKRKYN